MSISIPNATVEHRVTQFTYLRNIVDDGGMVNFTITKYLASDGSPTEHLIGTVSGMHQTHESVDAAICPGAAIPELGLPALTNPTSGNDLSAITQGDMVLIVERLCTILALQKGLL